MQLILPLAAVATLGALALFLAGLGGAPVSILPEREAAIQPAPESPTSPTRATMDAADASAPPFFLNGERVRAAVLPVFERRATDDVRHVCGGAVLAVPEGAPDPRGHHFDAYARLAYAVSFELVDETGRSWVVDRYDDVEAPDLSRAVWVANVGGDGAWRADDGASSCPPRSAGDIAFNVVVYTMEMEGPLNPYYLATSRPPAPDERTWWTGERPPPWSPA